MEVAKDLSGLYKVLLDRQGEQHLQPTKTRKLPSTTLSNVPCSGMPPMAPVFFRVSKFLSSELQTRCIWCKWRQRNGHLIAWYHYIEYFSNFKVPKTKATLFGISSLICSSCWFPDVTYIEIYGTPVNSVSAWDVEEIASGEDSVYLLKVNNTVKPTTTLIGIATNCFFINAE